MSEQESEQEQMPVWVARNYACRVMWKQDVIWRESAATVAENDIERQQMMIRLARHAAGGSEGQASEK